MVKVVPMHDRPVEFRRGKFVVSTDRRTLVLDDVLALLVTTFWAAAMPSEVLARAMDNSVCFGIWHQALLVGFGRVITDLSTHAYWTDVVVAHTYRGRGLGRWLGECMLEHPELQGLRRVSLLTRDAASLYSGLGFGTDLAGLIYMERRGN